MTKQELLQLITQGENEQIEFKKSFDAKALLAINAMANTHGGNVLLGVTDNGAIIGVDLQKESIQSWINEIKQKTEPSVTPNIQQFTDEGKNIVVFQVVEVPIKPISLQRRFYVRKFNSNHLLNADEITGLRLESINQSFDTFEVNVDFSELNKEAL